MPHGSHAYVPRYHCPDIAERILGHARGGVEGIYDRHQYRDEKAHALNSLAG